MNRRVFGLIAAWEVRLTATKCRDFFVYVGEDQWVSYRDWSGEEYFSFYPPVCIPGTYDYVRVQLKRFIKRNIFKDSH